MTLKWVATVIVFLVTTGIAQAEPWFAIKTGHKCVSCHVSPTGGGKRTTFGAMWAQTALSARTAQQFWDGTVTDRLSLGADARGSASEVSIPGGSSDRFAFETEEALLYAQFKLIPGQLFFYLDERVAPGGASSREAYVFYWLKENAAYIRAGRIFLPFGWRLEDDTAFIRQVPGINYNTPDDGLEVGIERDYWSAQLAITNGTAGAGEVDTGKQFSGRASYIRNRWRAGVSANVNDASGGSRKMYGVFAGVRTGPVNWLFEYDRVDDQGFTPGRDLDVAFIEGNWQIRQGVNLKGTYEYFDPDADVDNDDQNRASLVLELFPVQFTQISIGARSRDGIPQNALQNTDEYFLQLHVYF